MPSFDDAQVYTSPEMVKLSQLDPQKLRLMNQLYTQITQIEAAIAGLKHSMFEISTIFLADEEQAE